MERLLSNAKAADELKFVKDTAALLATQSIKYSSTYVPALESRPKRVTLAEVPVCELPKPKIESAPASVENITLTIKSSKPPLLFTISCPSTSTISALKSLLVEQEPTAPAIEAQRWLLKGKAMGDGKLLREFTVEDGSVVNLMVKAGLPELTLTTDSPPEDNKSPPLKLVIPPTPLESTASNPFSTPALWLEAHALLKRHFGSEDKAAEAFESWLSGAMASGSISASEKAKIREVTGLSAMGGI